MSRQVLIPVDLSRPGPPPSGQVQTLRGQTMGTTWSVKLVAESVPERLTAHIQRLLDRVVAQMSTWETHSDISRFNTAPPGTWRTLPDDFAAVLDHALHVAADSGGAFDPTIGPVVNLWGFGPDARRATPPEPASLAARRERCGWKRLTWDAALRRARQPGDLSLDLSGIAKGYAVDLVADRLRALGHGSFLVEVGGELQGRGIKPDGTPWWVTMETPAGTAGDTIVALHGLSAATSGDYRKFFMADGTRYSHTIDPRTGVPVAGDLASVTVLHARCMHADALATALTVLGVEDGMAFAAARGIAARFLSRAGETFAEYMTPAFTAMLE